ncbi:glycosyltransferase family 2 protein, partial [Candidatus Avelusimicrobium sp.]
MEQNHSSRPLISVLIPVYNAGKYLAETLTSIKNQTYSNLEIICID